MADKGVPSGSGDDAPNGVENGVGGSPAEVAPANDDDSATSGVKRPHAHDVMCGRGGGTNNHAGNQHWRSLVTSNKRLYLSLPKRRKMQVAKSIVQAIRMQNPPGRFLQKDSKTKMWYDIGDETAQHKTSQALREGAPDIRSEIKTEEAQKRKMMEMAASGAAVQLMPMPMAGGQMVGMVPQMQMQAMPPGQMHPFAMGMPMGRGAQQGVPLQQRPHSALAPGVPNNWTGAHPGSGPVAPNHQAEALLAARAQAQARVQLQARVRAQARSQQQAASVPAQSAAPPLATQPAATVPAQSAASARQRQNQAGGNFSPLLPRAPAPTRPAASSAAEDAASRAGVRSEIPSSVQSGASVAQTTVPASAPPSMSPPPTHTAVGPAAAQQAMPKSASTCELTASACASALMQQQRPQGGQTAHAARQRGHPHPASAPQSKAGSPDLLKTQAPAAAAGAAAPAAVGVSNIRTQAPAAAGVLSKAATLAANVEAGERLAVEARAAAEVADRIAEEARVARRQFELMSRQGGDNGFDDVTSTAANSAKDPRDVPSAAAGTAPALPPVHMMSERAKAAAAVAERAAEEARIATREYEILCQLHGGGSSGEAAAPPSAAATTGSIPTPLSMRMARTMPPEVQARDQIQAQAQALRGDMTAESALHQLHRDYEFSMRRQRQALLSMNHVVGPLPTLQARSSLGRRRVLPPNASVRFTYDQADRSPRGRANVDGVVGQGLGQAVQSSSLLDDDDEEEDGQRGSLRRLGGHAPGMMMEGIAAASGDDAEEQWNMVKAMIERQQTGGSNKRKHHSIADAHAVGVGRASFGDGRLAAALPSPSAATTRADTFGPFMPGFERNISMMSNISGTFSDIGGDDETDDSGDKKVPANAGPGTAMTTPGADGLPRDASTTAGVVAASASALVAAPVVLTRGLSGGHTAGGGTAAAPPPTALRRGLMSGGNDAAEGETLAATALLRGLSGNNAAAAAGMATSLTRGLSGNHAAAGGGMASPAAAGHPSALLRGFSGIHAAASFAPVDTTPTSFLRGLSGGTAAVEGLAAAAVGATPTTLYRDISALSVAGIGAPAAAAPPAGGLLRSLSSFGAPAGAAPSPGGLLRGISGFSAVGNFEMPSFDRNASTFSEMSMPEQQKH